ncbi:MAG: hypothetical protein Q8P50_08690 [Bacillota bacterium]|nr:hypothetical protein [Bacillota bacterium]
MFRIWPRLARKNLFMILAFRFPGKWRVVLPLPLFVIDDILEPLGLLGAILPLRVPTGLARRFSLRLDLGAVAGALSEAWRSLRWKGAFTLADVNQDGMEISIRFV